MRWPAAIICVLLMVGCSSVKTALYKVTGAQAAKEREVAALRVEYDGKIAAKTSEITTAKDGVIAGQQNQMRGAAAALFGQSLVFQSLPQPTRTDLITHNLSNEASAALGNVTPTAEAMKAMIERVSKELDATKTSLADLQRNHEAALVENQKLVDKTKEWETKLAAAEREKGALESSYRTQLDQKQTALVALANEKAALEKARADDAAALQALKTKFSIILGVLALAGIAGAIYSPIAKDKCAIFGILCSAAAIGIWWIQPWHVALVVGVGLVALIGWMLTKHRTDERLSDSLTLAMNDLKEKGGEAWAAAEPVFADRLKTYRKKGGQLVAETDHKLQDYIHRKLADFDQL